MGGSAWPDRPWLRPPRLSRAMSRLFLTTPHPPCCPPPQVYSQLDGDRSHAVNTGWALLALLAAGYHEVDRKPLDAAARCLIRLQARLGRGAWEGRLLCLLPAGQCGSTVTMPAATARCAAEQEESGDWPQQHISGVFNRNCMITYANYRWVRVAGWKGRARRQRMALGARIASQP